MAETVSIAITGDITELQAAMEAAVDNVNTAADNFISEFERTGEATTRLAGTVQQAASLIEHVGESGDAAASGVSRLGEAAAGMATDIGASTLEAAAKAIFEFGKNAFDSAVNIEHEADALGTSTTALQAYQYAARESGVSQQDADTALKTFASNMVALQENAGPAVSAVRDLGLTADELRGDPLEAMETVARAWAKLNAEEEKANILRELSGRSGQDMAAMMDRLADGLDRQAVAARNAGEMLDPRVTDAAKRGRAEIEGLTTFIEDRAAEAVLDLGQTFQELAKDIANVPWSEAMARLGNAITGRQPAPPPKPRPGPDQDLLAMANAPMPLPAPGPPIAEPQIKIDSPEQQIAKAQQAAKKIDAIYRQTNDAILQGEEQLNASRLKLDQESLAQFTAQQLKFAQEKYTGDLHEEMRLESDGTITHAEFAAKKALLDQQYANRKAQIEEEAAEKYRQQNQQDLQSYISSEQIKLKEGITSFDEQYRAAQISANQRGQMEVSLTSTIQKNIDDRLEFEMEGLELNSAAYEALQKQKDKIDEEFRQRHQQVTSQLAKDDAAAWNEASREILSSEDTLVHDLLTKRQSLGLDMLQMVGQMAEKEIESDLRLWTQKALIAALGSDRIKATEQGGFLWNLIFGQQDVAQTAETETKKTAVVTAGVTAQTAEQKAGSAAGLAAQAAAGSSQILNNAYVAASGAFSALSSIPIIGPELGAVAAGATFAAVMAFDSLTSMDVGAWELPRDMPAMLHKGEMVVPQNFASGLRSNGGMGGGGDGVTFNTHYYPTINMREPASLKDMLQGSGAELFDAIQRGYRTGLPMRPSMRSL